MEYLILTDGIIVLDSYFILTNNLISLSCLTRFNTIFLDN